jgi:Cu-Zn family superoxide dismutase
MSAPRPPPPRWDQYDRLHVDDADESDPIDRRLLNGDSSSNATYIRKRRRRMAHKWTTWSFVACIFIGITILLAIIVGILASVFYETRNASHQREALLLERAGGHAEAYLFRRDDGSVHSEAGLIRIYSEEDGFRVVAEVSSLKPNSIHAMHIFEFTDPNGEELGNIYSPEPVTHGCPGVSVEHRVGDLGNVVVNKFGVAMYDQKVKGASITDIIGRTIAIHANKDDCISQPLGGSGKIVASGVIGLGNPSQSEAEKPMDKGMSGPSNGGGVALNGVASVAGPTSVLRSNMRNTPIATAVASAVTHRGNTDSMPIVSIQNRRGRLSSPPSSNLPPSLPLAIVSSKSTPAPAHKSPVGPLRPSYTSHTTPAPAPKIKNGVIKSTTLASVKSMDLKQREKLKKILKEKIKKMLHKEKGNVPSPAPPAQCRTLQSAAKTVKDLYHTVLCREPDFSGFKFWIRKCMSGTTIVEIKAVMKKTLEFKKLPAQGCIHGIGRAIRSSLEEVTAMPVNDNAENDSSSQDDGNDNKIDQKVGVILFYTFFRF